MYLNGRYHDSDPPWFPSSEATNLSRPRVKAYTLDPTCRYRSTYRLLHNPRAATPDLHHPDDRLLRVLSLIEIGRQGNGLLVEPNLDPDTLLGSVWLTSCRG